MKKIKIIFLTLLVFACSRFYGQDTLNVGRPVVVTPAIPVSWVYLDTAMFTFTDTSTVFNDISGLNNNSNFRRALNSYSLPALSNDALKNYADSIKKSCTICAYSNPYGYGIRNSINFKNAAQYYNPHIAGGKLWIMRMTSATALGLQFYFSKFMIPNNSFLHIYTADRAKILGPYTSDNTPSDSTKAIHFGTVPIHANDVYIEYYESDQANYTGNIVFDNSVHLFDDEDGGYGNSAICQNDVACQADWNNQVASVALILLYSDVSNLAGTCTGSLLNNTSNDGTPYFLTASHCLYSDAGSAYDVSTWQFVFDYQNPCCGGNNGEDPGYGNHIVFGADLKAGDHVDASCTGEPVPNTSDYLLLLLNEDVSSWGVCFNGWNANPNQQPEEYGHYTMIHHPVGDVMKISHSGGLYCPGYDVNGQYNSDPSCPDPANNICRCPPNANTTCKLNSQYFYNTAFLNDEPEPQHGSSGAPLFNDADGLLIGTLTGAGPDGENNDPCTTPNKPEQLLFCGRFSDQYTHFTYTNQFGQTVNYLDPSGSLTGGVDISCASRCASGGPVLATCTGGGDGGTTAVACDGLPRSILVNNLDGIPVICNPTYITIGNDLWFSLENSRSTNYHNIHAGIYNYPAGSIGYNQNLDHGCNGFDCVCQNNACVNFNICGGCKYWYGAYGIYIVEMSFNNSPVQSWGRNYEFDSYAAYTWTDNCSTWMWGTHSITFTPSDINGAVLQPGKFYVIGIQTNNELPHGTTYKTSSRLVYIMPNSFFGTSPSDYTATNTTIGDAVNTWDVRSIEAEDNIKLDKTNVLADVGALVAGNSIHIEKDATGESHLQGGHYYLTSIDLCNKPEKDLRVRNTDQNANPQNPASQSSSPVTKPSYFQNIQPNNKSNVNTPSFLIYPNPANNNIIAEFKNGPPKANSPITVNIYNSLGEIVKNESINLFDRYVSLSVDGLAPGMYNIIIIQGTKTWQSKVVKQ